MPTPRKVPNQLWACSRAIRAQLAGLTLCLIALPSCILVSQRSSPTDGPKAVSTLPKAAWSVIPTDFDSTDSIGWVIRFQEAGESARSFYSVRNLHHQELGLVDTLGRAWKYQPFQKEANWLGSGSVPEGVSSILCPGSPVTLVENSVSAIETRL
jgi:hypothetical protein